ncbi:MAG: MFS transporter [Acidobacteriaceae bacterium]|nr:MFS transporter [Acidobacteriaceae bacterium]
MNPPEQRTETYDRVDGPTTPWLAVGFVLAGLGTALLGPILPYLAHQWHLSDATSGALFFAKFVGAFLGGASVARRLRLSIFLGAVLGCVGFGTFALASGPMLGGALLFVGGFGLGQIIAATNILAGRRYEEHTGSALASLNFFWSLGAVVTGVLAGITVPRFGLRMPLFVLAALFLAAGSGGWFSTQKAQAKQSKVVLQPLETGAFVRFALLLFLYGGLETCLTSWLTTFSLRFTDAHLLNEQSAVVLFWSALTAGRLLASLLLRWWSERSVQIGSMLLGALLVVAVSLSHSSLTLSAECIALGLVLAPYFPAVFGTLMRLNPSARSAGMILAVSGLGAALFPWLMGLVSTATGSLRIAMLLPAAIALVMLALNWIGQAATSITIPTGEAEANVVSS